MLNYDRRAQATHTRNSPVAPGSGDQGDYTTRPYRPLCQYQDMQQIYLMYRNKHRAAAKVRQTNMSQMKE